MNSHASHCESCGQDNPRTEDGYTTCCNELVCDGGSYTFGPDTGKTVRACCWAKAEAKFGGADKVPDDSYRHA